jgi:hypothetical protein
MVASVAVVKLRIWMVLFTIYVMSSVVTLWVVAYELRELKKNNFEQAKQIAVLEVEAQEAAREDVYLDRRVWDHTMQIPQIRMANEYVLQIYWETKEQGVCEASIDVSGQNDPHSHSGTIECKGRVQ